MRVTMAHIAERAGVSVSAVSYAFSGKRKLLPATRRKIFDAATELGYPIPSSVFTKRQRAHAIAVSAPIHSYSTMRGYSAFFFETLNALRKYKCDLLLCANETDEFERIAREAAVDGVLLLDVKEDDKRVIRAEQLAFPTVSVGIARGEVPDDHTKVFSIDLDFKAAARMTIERVVNAKRKHVLYVGANERAYREGSNYLNRYKRWLSRYAMQNLVALDCVFWPDEIQDEANYVRRVLEQKPEIDTVVIQAEGDNATAVYAQIAQEVRSGRLAALAIGSYGRLDTNYITLDEIPLEPRQACHRAVDVLAMLIEGSVKFAGRTEYIVPRYIDRGTMRKQLCDGTEAQ